MIPTVEQDAFIPSDNPEQNHGSQLCLEVSTELNGELTDHNAVAIDLDFRVQCGAWWVLGAQCADRTQAPYDMVECFVDLVLRCDPSALIESCDHPREDRIVRGRHEDVAQRCNHRSPGGCEHLSIVNVGVADG